MKKILLIEDWQPIARAMKALLEQAGFQVTWLVGVTSHQHTNGGVILNGLRENGRTETVDCRQFQIAFVDGQLEGNIQGPALVPLLVASGVACCGMSTVSDMNQEMVARGATMAFKKPIVLAGLLSQKFSAAYVPAPSRALIRAMTHAENRFTTPLFAELREQADAFLKPYMAEQK